MPKKVSLDGGSSSSSNAKANAKSGGSDDKNKKIAMIVIAVVCLAAAGGVTAFQLGLIGSTEKPLTVEDTGVPYEDTITDPVEKKKYVDRLKFLEAESKKQTPAGS